MSLLFLVTDVVPLMSLLLFAFLLNPPPPRSTLFPTRRSSDLLTPLDDNPHVVNPPLGWLYNTNDGPWWGAGPDSPKRAEDRKSTRLNSSHANISYAVFCLKKKKNSKTLQKTSKTKIGCPKHDS